VLRIGVGEVGRAVQKQAHYQAALHTDSILIMP